jgi:elongator complex protein 4
MQTGKLVAVEERDYEVLYERINRTIVDGGFLTAASPRSILRIVIQSIGTLDWTTDVHYAFLWRLKLLLRKSHAVCIFTIPGMILTLTIEAYLYNDHHALSSNPFIRAVEILVDAVVEVESFAGTPRKLNPVYTISTPLNPAYHGLIHPVKAYGRRMRVPSVSKTLEASQMRSLAFRCRRKRVTIETFHLPPEDGEEEEVAPKGHDF